MENTTAPVGLPQGALGNLRQACVVTRDLRRTVGRMLAMGIGPWSVYTFSPDNCTEMTYRAQPGRFAFRAAFATNLNQWWEVIEPLRGPSIYEDFLAGHGEGVQHLLYDLNGVSWEEKRRLLAESGFDCIQSGRWSGGFRFAYYDMPAVTVEIVDTPAGWVRPDPEEIIGR